MIKEIYFAGGCFWGVEHYFSLIPGVTMTEAGYANGQTEHPSYEEVCRQDTGHAETVRVQYDSDKITLYELLLKFYRIIDPTLLNRQGNDRGTQYRTGIYYQDQTEATLISKSLRKLQRNYDQPVVVETKALECYYPAEEDHQNYLQRNPAGYCHISPALFGEPVMTNKK